MRAPPESLMPMIGMRFFRARSITLMTFSANTSPSDPPKTVASWLNSITSRPPILAMPVTTPSPAIRFDSRPKPDERWTAKMSSSSNELRSTRREMRSRAVSLCLACWRLNASASPWPASYFRCRSRFRGSTRCSGFDLSGIRSRPLHEHPAVTFQILGAIFAAVLVVLERRQDGRASRARTLVVRLHVVDVDQHPVDDVRHLRPPRRLVAIVPMALRAPVVRRRRREHDHPGAGLHLAVGQVAVTRRRHPRPFAKAENSRQPVERGRPVLVGDHRNYPSNPSPFRERVRVRPSNPSPFRERVRVRPSNPSPLRERVRVRVPIGVRIRFVHLRGLGRTILA